MCGIIGSIGKTGKVPVSLHLGILRRAISHRGPDAYGEFIEDKCGFANLRLAIVDVASGNQPIYNDNHSIGIVYNGEIYNFERLRVELESKGHFFKTKTDTEVVLKMYEEYGVESFGKFNGMFAFCIWDNNKNCIYLVRDRIGIKPLYFYEDPYELIFSSELKGILQIPNLDLGLDPTGFEDYLTFRYVQAPYTFFKNIKRLEAGTYLEIKGGAASRYRYWDVTYRDIYPAPDLEKTKRALLEMVENSVKSQLMGEVPVGVLLSGGLDSSTIAYFVKKCGANLKTFNIGFESLNEFKYSSFVAKNLGLEHMEVFVGMDDFIKEFDKVMFALDEPIADPACFPLYILGQELKKHVTVVLSGEGSDELFGGYPQYISLLKNNPPYRERFYSFLDGSYYFRDSVRFIKKSGHPLAMRHKKYFEEQPLLNGMLAYDIKTWIPENLMMKADKILMAHSLEGRFPFLDNDIFDFAACNIPQCFKVDKKFESKSILKESMAGLLPEEIIHRKKMGFSVPVDKILDKMKETVTAAFCSADGLEMAGILDMEGIRSFVDGYYNGKKEHALQVWTLFVLTYWFVNVLPFYENERKRFETSAKSAFIEKVKKPGTYMRERLNGPNAPQKMDVRNRLSKTYIRGKGIEIGAWYSPLAVFENASVKYVDILDEKEHRRRNPDVKFEFARVDIIDDGEILSKIPDNSQDFIIANHLLEHASNPIGTIRLHLSKLKKDGIIFYAIPNKDFTFDKNRSITCFQHLLSNDSNGAVDIFDHYLDWAANAEGMTEKELIYDRATKLREADQRIHFHVWDADALEDFFLRTKDYLQDSFDVLRFAEVDNEVIVILSRRV